MAIFAIATNESGPQNTLGVLTVPVSDSDWIRGQKNAEVVIVNYSDFQCPACAYYYEQVKQLEEEFGGQIAVVYRHFPLEQTHKYARLAARVAEASGRQGKFWEMHDMLFINQQAWSENSDPSILFASYAGALGMDMDKFMKDVNSADIDNKISGDYQGGIGAGIQGTPTFFVNGKQIENPRSYEEFKAIIQLEINSQ